MLKAKQRFSQQENERSCSKKHFKLNKLLYMNHVRFLKATKQEKIQVMNRRGLRKQKWQNCSYSKEKVIPQLSSSSFFLLFHSSIISKCLFSGSENWTKTLMNTSSPPMRP
ncbi:hypothetical protein L6164_017255 [Bauhinia variegata]|uniref:Uncharacterized protein n=1 Tax=Bauhinia variegata TaxID=167791 RepID=A0ACB9N7A9_BAUVA|nr:hypothetical protein L6164_017255 [Bauhinia variegata]